MILPSAFGVTGTTDAWLTLELFREKVPGTRRKQLFFKEEDVEWSHIIQFSLCNIS
jgi:hypothetical protein